MAITVTATQAGTTNPGTVLTVKVLTGATGPQGGATASSGTTTTPQLSIAAGTGNLVYGVVTANVASTYTALANTTFQNNTVAVFGTYRSTSTTSGTATYGASAPTVGGAGQLSIAELEIVAAASGTLAEDSSSPPVLVNASATSLTTASFTPPAGSLIVAMIGTNGGQAGTVTASPSDTSGMRWTQKVSVSGSGLGYAGVWIAQVPGLPLRAARRIAAPVPALPAQRRMRQMPPPPAQLAPVAEVAQRRQTWPRGLPRRARITVVVRPQLNPPYPFAEVRQQRQPRGFFPRRGHVFAPVPAQQAAPQAPAFVSQPLRHARLVAAGRRRQPVVPVPVQDAPLRQRAVSRPWRPVMRRGRLVQVPQAQAAPAPPAHPVTFRRATPRGIRLARGRLAQPVPPQAQAPASPAWVSPHRSPLRAIALLRRRFRQLFPWPQAAQPPAAPSPGTPTAVTVPGATLTAADAAGGMLTAGTASSGLTAATAAQGGLTAGTQSTGGPS